MENKGQYIWLFAVSLIPKANGENRSPRLIASFALEVTERLRSLPVVPPIKTSSLEGSSIQ